jgi:hypothetical protein
MPKLPAGDVKLAAPASLAPELLTERVPDPPPLTPPPEPDTETPVLSVGVLEEAAATAPSTVPMARVVMKAPKRLRFRNAPRPGCECIEMFVALSWGDGSSGDRGCLVDHPCRLIPRYQGNCFVASWTSC